MEVITNQPKDGLDTGGTTKNPGQFPLQAVPKVITSDPVMDDGDWWNPLNSGGFSLSPFL
jgi:hypothetical protein